MVEMTSTRRLFKIFLCILILIMFYVTINDNSFEKFNQFSNVTEFIKTNKNPYDNSDAPIYFLEIDTKRNLVYIPDNKLFFINTFGSNGSVFALPPDSLLSTLSSDSKVFPLKLFLHNTYFIYNFDDSKIDTIDTILDPYAIDNLIMYDYNKKIFFLINYTKQQIFYFNITLDGFLYPTQNIDNSKKIDFIRTT